MIDSNYLFSNFIVNTFGSVPFAMPKCHRINFDVFNDVFISFFFILFYKLFLWIIDLKLFPHFRSLLLSIINRKSDISIQIQCAMSNDDDIAFRWNRINWWNLKFDAHDIQFYWSVMNKICHFLLTNCCWRCELNNFSILLCLTRISPFRAAFVSR